MFAVTAAMTASTTAAAPCLWIFPFLYLTINHITAVQTNAACNEKIYKHVFFLLFILLPVLMSLYLFSCAYKGPDEAGKTTSLPLPESLLPSLR